MLENVVNELFNFRTTLILIKHVATAAHKQHCKAEKLKIYLNGFMYFNLSRARHKIYLHQTLLHDNYNEGYQILAKNA